jgi:LmbE family N-acetylglucosaminyl deacetylase
VFICGCILFSLLLAISAGGQGPAAAGRSLPEALEAIERAGVGTRILYVTAHPDDEPGGLLAYLARGLHADVALLSLTRGEGGQNALGPEQAPQLGVIRTAELERATRIYGTRLFFTRASDFGYTKSAEEAIKTWGAPVLEDMVFVLRTFRPHVVVNSWGGVRTGHGQHQAAGILVPQAVRAAADSAAFPEQLRAGLRVWKADALLQLARGTFTAAGPGVQQPAGLDLPLNDLAPLWGKSWNEIGVEGYSSHRSQGVAGVRTSAFARRAIRLLGAAGEPVTREMLAAPLASLARRYPMFERDLRPALAQAEQHVAGALAAARALDAKNAERHLGEAAAMLAAIRLDAAGTSPETAAEAMQDLAAAVKRFERAMEIVAGLEVRATSDRAELVPGETFSVRVESRALPGVLDEVSSAGIEAPRGWSVEALPAGEERGQVYRIRPPKEAARTESPMHRIEAWPAAPVTARVAGVAGGHRFSVSEPVTALRLTSTSAEELPLRVVPAVTLSIEPQSVVLPSASPRRQIELLVRVRHYSTAREKITVGVDLPAGWPLPAEQALEFDGTGDQMARFRVALPARPAAGRHLLAARARNAEGEQFRLSLEPLPALPAQLWEEPAQARVHVMELSVPPKLRVGYIAAENDPIPRALENLGVEVTLLDEAALAFGDLGKFDAVCVGIRAYELRQDLNRANRRLLDYAASGGTLVVQYQREGVWNRLMPAPYPARGSGNDSRTADENAPVRILEPAHPLLHFPNAIRGEDFDGWVQERGLYYLSEFDARYAPLLAMKDPGDAAESRGSLLVAQHGKGTYIYTGLSFFRQLPEGVPGACRLFLNLLSASRRAAAQAGPRR